MSGSTLQIVPPGARPIRPTARRRAALAIPTGALLYTVVLAAFVPSALALWIFGIALLLLGWGWARAARRLTHEQLRAYGSFDGRWGINIGEWLFSRLPLGFASKLELLCGWALLAFGVAAIGASLARAAGLV